MAVYAAHLTRTLQGAPSVFQVTAQEALAATVKPACGKLVEYLSEVYPRRLGWCARWYDELFLLADACLQYHYLKHYAASFSESFYGLVRVPTAARAEFHSGARLPHALEMGSLAMLVLLPYIRDKLEKIIDKWREDEEDGRLGKSAAEAARRGAVRLHAALHAAAAAARLALLARYLAAGAAGAAGGGGVRSASPALAALGLALRDAPPQDAHGDSWGDLFRAIRNGRFGSVSFPLLGALLLRAAEYGAFAVQFARWWEARATSTSTATSGLATTTTSGCTAVPPPPQKDESVARFQNKCPLCLQPWRTPTALPVSGLIFCYSCISRALRTRRECPVTSLPAGEESLVRVYPR